MHDLKEGTRATFTLTGTVKCVSPSDMYIDLRTDDGRAHVIERPKPADYEVIRTMYVGEVWKIPNGKMFFVRAWVGFNRAADEKKVIPAAATGETYDCQKFLDEFPDAECIFSP